MNNENLVTIIYKSGAKVRAHVEDLKVTRYADGRLDVSWKDFQPRPLLLGVDEIAAIYVGKV